MLVLLAYHRIMADIGVAAERRNSIQQHHKVARMFGTGGFMAYSGASQAPGARFPPE
jgi:hypothetical protein